LAHRVEHAASCRCGRPGREARRQQLFPARQCRHNVTHARLAGSAAHTSSPVSLAASLAAPICLWWALVLGGVRPSSALQQQQCSCPALHQRVHTLRSAHPDDQCQGAHTTHGVSHAAGPVLAPLPPHQHGERSSRRWTYHCSGADAVRVSSRSSSPAQGAQAHGALAMSRMSCRALPTPYRIASASPRALAHPYSTNSSSWQVG